VEEVRQIGSVAAIELKAQDHGYSSNLRAKLYKYFLDQGVLLRPLGNVVYILPPYVITLEELDYIYGIIGEALEKI
jgi:adenosylmethionine---8-amino-7-oxononanoate aminotransferase